LKYLSPTIQNELIETLSCQLEKNLIRDILAAPFFTVIADTTQDLSKVDQLSQVYRYVSILKSDDNHPIDITIRELFLGFYACHDQSAAGVSSLILEITDGKGLPLERCRSRSGL